MSEYKELSCLAYDLRKKVVEMVVSVPVCCEEQHAYNPL